MRLDQIFDDLTVIGASLIFRMLKAKRFVIRIVFVKPVIPVIIADN
jgi:hypothetical protein